MGERRKSRRFWSLAEKRRIVAETRLPGASVSIVARRHDVNANQVFRWRRELAVGDRAALPAACEFVPLGVFAEVEGKSPSEKFARHFIGLRSTAGEEPSLPDAGASGKLGDEAGADRKPTGGELGSGTCFVVGRPTMRCIDGRPTPRNCSLPSS